MYSRQQNDNALPQGHTEALKSPRCVRTFLRTTPRLIVQIICINILIHSLSSGNKSHGMISVSDCVGTGNLIRYLLLLSESPKSPCAALPQNADPSHNAYVIITAWYQSFELVAERKSRTNFLILRSSEIASCLTRASACHGLSCELI